MALGGSYQDFKLEMFTDNLQHELQQTGSVLSNTVLNEMVAGTTTYFNKFGKMSSYTKSQRGELKTFNEQTHERRAVTFHMNSSDHILDPEDLLNMVSNPQSDVIRAMTFELGRQTDADIFNAISGTANRILNGTPGTVSLGSGNKVAVNSHLYSPVAGTNDICLTPSKLKEALKIMAANYVNIAQEEIFVVGPANQLAFLMTQPEVTSHDFRNIKPLDIPGLYPGIQGYLGLNYVLYENTDLVNGSDQTVYVYAKSAVKRGVRKPLTVEILKDPGRVGNPELISAFIDEGSVRMEEGAVVQIACDPSVHIPA